MRSRIIIAIAALLVIFSCEKPIEPIQRTEEVSLSGKIVNVGLTSFDVQITAPEASPYYIACYKAEDFKGVSVSGIIDDIRRKTDLGAAWASFLKVGNQTITFPSLYSNTKYRVVLFGMNASGETTSEPMILTTTTQSFGASASLESSTPFSFTIEVDPDRDDIGWFGVAFTGSASRLDTIDDELLLTYIRYYIGEDSASGATYEEIAKFGHGFYSGECNPDDNLLFTVVAIDKNLRVVSGLTKLRFDPSQEGLQIFDEKRTSHIHSFIYAYDHKELGVMIDFTGYDVAYPGFPNNTISFNGDSKSYYGIDMYKSTDLECATALASELQAQLEAAMANPAYSSYFAQCQTPEDCLGLVAYTTQNFYDNGKIWYRLSPEEVMSSLDGNSIDEVAFPISINRIDGNLHVYPYEYCVSRVRFSELDYSFETSPTKASVKVLEKQNTSKVRLVRL
ncbi:MAG: hypothetical protein MJZ16_14290 [Bacteroidales bacterium]|nr:hypothetical protein [Bacteroidales bacterium]